MPLFLGVKNALFLGVSRNLEKYQVIPEFWFCGRDIEAEGNKEKIKKLFSDNPEFPETSPDKEAEAQRGDERSAGQEEGAVDLTAQHE